MHKFEQALLFSKNEAIENQLNNIYKQVPNGTCCGSTRCCSESVNCFYSEYLNIVAELNSKKIYEEFSKKAVYYWLCEFSMPMKCSFLKNNSLCAIYESRPLPCRVFGHLNKADYLANAAEINQQNLESVTELMDAYQIKVPESVTTHRQISFCENFKSETGMSLDDRDDLIDQLFGIESLFLAEELLDFDEINFSLTQWFAYEYFGRAKANELRIQISREFTDLGVSETLNGLNLK